MQIRKTIKTRGHFPNDDAALRLIWLSIQRAKTSWRKCFDKLDTSPSSPPHPLRRPHPRLTHPPIHRKTRRLPQA